VLFAEAVNGSSSGIGYHAAQESFASYSSHGHDGARLLSAA
jgi:hypothetical protein